MPARIIAIIGAGPVGLAAAAHAVERGLAPVVIEQGPSAGHAMRQWAHVQTFSPWSLNLDRAATRLLEPTGWRRPDPAAHPTGGEIVDLYLDPLARHPRLAAALRFSSRVTAIGRSGLDKAKTAGRETAPFDLHLATANGPETIHADAVIDASGTWFSPNPGGAGGLPAIGEAEAARRIAYGMPDISGRDRGRYAGRRVAVIGGGHSAVGSLIELARLAEAAPETRPLWLYRGPRIARAFGGGGGDQLAARGALGATIARFVQDGRIAVEENFRLARIAARAGGLEMSDGARRILADELIVATGFRPDLSFLRELRVDLDAGLECPPTLAPLIDPNVHSCGTVRPHGAVELAHPEPNFYIAGMKAYGRAPTFLMATGYEQARSIVAELAGDRVAARRVELVLPETGVCNGPAEPQAEAKGCCGGAPVAREDACCRKDEIAKEAGAPGCGCGAPPPVRELANV